MSNNCNYSIWHKEQDGYFSRNCTDVYPCRCPLFNGGLNKVIIENKSVYNHLMSSLRLMLRRSDVFV